MLNASVYCEEIRLPDVEEGVEKMTTLAVGQFVLDVGSGLGPGRLISVHDDVATIEYFCSIANRRSHSAPASQIEPYAVSPQERCYVSFEDGWRMGRVKNGPDAHAGISTYFVQFPNQEAEEVSPDSLFLRWWAPVEDPLETLILHGHESPFFHDRRWEFIRAITEQRAACEGMAAVLSSSIELRPHQVDVARRVLADSVQRYLLADEVGLGKTIEAGIIARQVLIEDSRAVIRVFAPDALLLQWREELDKRFHLFSDFPDAAVHLSPFEELGRLGRVGGSCSLLVIDEAHHVAGWCFSGNSRLEQMYGNAARLAHGSDRTLLLSATPVRHNEANYLAMLHLLEPSLYALDDMDGFLRRVRDRDKIAELLNGLTEDVAEYDFLIVESLDELERDFEADERLLHLCSEMRALLSRPARTTLHIEEARTALRRIRVHIAETYRLHRRMIRYRRDGPAGVLVRGRVMAATVMDRDSRLLDVEQHLDLWRQLVRAWMEGGVGSVQWGAYLGLMQGFFEAAGTDLMVLGALCRERLAASAVHGDTPADPPLVPGEVGRLEALAEAAGRPTDVDRIGTFLDWLHDEAPPSVLSPARKVVVFTAYTLVAGEISRRLSQRYSAKSFAVHTAAMSAEELGRSVVRFQSDPSCSLIVCDASAEEGLNLQAADAIFHFDVPWNANRLEQRIGRSDRYGRGAPVQSVVLTAPEPVAPIQACLSRLMSDSYGVFDRSISALLYSVEDDLGLLRTAVLEGGVQGIEAHTASVAERAEIALRQVKAQDQVDAIALGDESEFEAMVDSIMECEAGPIKSAHHEWFAALNFASTLELAANGRDELVKYLADPREVMVPWNRLARDFMDCLGRQSSYSRMAAVRNIGVHLLRFGNPLIDAMRRYVEVDDRGQAHLFWRFDPSLPLDDMRFVLRANYVIEADTSKVDALVAEGLVKPQGRSSVLRRLDAAFAPRAMTVWVDDQLRVVEDEQTVSLLTVAYKGDSALADTNLSTPRLAPVNAVMPPGAWRDFCIGASGVASHEVRRSVKLDESVARGEEQVLLDSQLRVERRRARVGVADLEALELSREILVEERVRDAMVAAIQRPRVRLDSVGCVVLAGFNPFAAVSGDS